MKKEITNIFSQLQRPLYFLAGLVLVVPLASSAVAFANAAGGQVQSRQIMMSDNGVSGSTITTGVGSGTNVSYRVIFTPAEAYTIKGIILDFCAGTGGTPFIGDSTCAAPTSFTVGATPTVDVTNYTINGGSTVVATGIGGSWTASSLNSGQTLKMTSASGAVLSAGVSYTFEITGITNPSDLGTFYARLITYTSDTGSITSYAHDTPGSYQDYGGFALSTANIVQVTAKVQETLTFCVGGSSVIAPAGSPPTLTPFTDCTSNTNPPAVTLGHGQNDTLDAQQVDTNGVFTYTSTNALHGLVIRMHTSNACGGLSIDGGTTCSIPAIGGGATTPSAITAGTAAFGMFCNQATADAIVHTGSSVNCDAGYYDSAHATSGNTNYGMDTTDPSDSIVSTFGDKIASATGATNGAINEFDFAATASNTTPAGIYKTNLAMIATGTF